MTQETKHTPTPWNINDQRASGWMNNSIYISSQTGFNLARVYDDAPNDSEANAAFIVHACNTHDEAIKLINDYAETLKSEWGPFFPEYPDDKSEAARSYADSLNWLAKARGEANHG